MATGSVSAIDREEWQLIESKSASGTSLTFNAFSGYKHLWLTGKAITKSSSDYVCIRPNNNSTAGVYAFQNNVGGDTRFFSAGSIATAQAVSFKIFDVDKTTPKRVASSYDASQPSEEQTAFTDTVAVTSLVVFTNSGTATFTGGTFYLYGIVA
jgi:hypothetical protein